MTAELGIAAIACVTCLAVGWWLGYGHALRHRQWFDETKKRVDAVKRTGGSDDCSE